MTMLILQIRWFLNQLPFYSRLIPPPCFVCLSWYYIFFQIYTSFHWQYGGNYILLAQIVSPSHCLLDCILHFWSFRCGCSSTTKASQLSRMSSSIFLLTDKNQSLSARSMSLFSFVCPVILQSGQDYSHCTGSFIKCSFVKFKFQISIIILVK